MGFLLFLLFLSLVAMFVFSLLDELERMNQTLARERQEAPARAQQLVADWQRRHAAALARQTEQAR